MPQGQCNVTVDRNTYLAKIAEIKDEVFMIRSKLGFILSESPKEKDAMRSISELDYELGLLLNIIRTLKEDIKI